MSTNANESSGFTDIREVSLSCLKFASNFTPEVALSGSIISIANFINLFPNVTINIEAANTEWQLLGEGKFNNGLNENTDLNIFWKAVANAKNCLGEYNPLTNEIINLNQRLGSEDTSKKSVAELLSDNREKMKERLDKKRKKPFKFKVGDLVLVRSEPPNIYSDEFDNIDIDEILSNKRLVDNYLYCIKTGKKCTPDGLKARELIPDALKSKCVNCSQSQKDKAEKILEWAIQNRAKDFLEIEQIFDPQHNFRKEYEVELKGRNIIFPPLKE
ncbi:hypothetical protein RN001_001950 [Aquatica leii]|uniref:Uncharacterized protein n=1 Tax=Aquatica leii TaxID=1421715 RepID=A0AAN7Q4Q8_9COLE|nr:hypothetical protein RN001_001950 [Aquatica leii]